MLHKPQQERTKHGENFILSIFSYTDTDRLFHPFLFNICKTKLKRQQQKLSYISVLVSLTMDTMYIQRETDMAWDR